jgi:enamine deaminase RidA (YjgF/YER057c/UK114 family)
MSIERLVNNPGSGFAEAVTTVGPGRVVYVSGCVGFGPEGKVVDGGMRAEAAATFDNIELDEYADYAAVRSERFGEQLPASATVQVAGLLVGAQIEIDAVAFIPEG